MKLTNTNVASKKVGSYGVCGMISCDDVVRNTHLARALEEPSA